MRKEYDIILNEVNYNDKEEGTKMYSEDTSITLFNPHNNP